MTLFSYWQAQGQVLLSEDFDFSSELTANGWTAHSGAGTNALKASSGNGLVYSGLSASGNAVDFLASGEDVNKSLSSPVTSGSVYASFLIKVTSVKSTADYFTHFMANNNTFYGRLFVRQSGSGYQIGIEKSGSTPAYGNTTLSYGTTYLIVVKYTFQDGATNDVAGVYVNPTTASEPTSFETQIATGNDATSFTGYALRQGSNTPVLTLDRIRVSTNWSALFSGVAAPSFTASSASNLNYQVGNGPADGSFKLSGSNLTGSDPTVTVTSPSSSVLVSADNVNFTTTATFTYSGSSFTDQVIYTRLIAGLSFGNYSTSLSISGGGASGSVAVSATVTNSAGCPTSGTMSIACAREQALLLAAPGNINSTATVTVTGTVIVSSQFTGETFYIQDATGGIAIYSGSNPGLSRTVGEQIRVTGNVTYYYGVIEMVNPVITGGLAEAAVTPETLTGVSDMSSPARQGKLVQLENVTVTDSRPYFCVRQNYSFSTPGGTGELRIQSGVADLLNSGKPAGAITLTGVLDAYDPDDNPSTSNSTYQIQPRSNADLPGTTEYTPAGADVNKNATLDVVSWNLEWLGNANGPVNRGTNYDNQVANASTIMTQLNADVYVVPETVDENVLQRITNNLSGSLGATYAKVCPPVDGTCGSHSAANQKMCFVYNTSVLSNITTTCLGSVAGFTASNWASGRFPFQLNADVTINGTSQNVTFIAVHAKAGDTQSDYNQRLNAANELHTYIRTNYNNAPVIIAGDWNDDMDRSITLNNGVPNATPYTPFTTNSAEYSVLTLPLSEAGFGSTITFDNMIDHMIISNELGVNGEKLRYLSGSVGTISGDYIPAINILTTTSDHVPVFARFSVAEGPTPVSWLDFKGKLNEKEQIELTWATASEQNNSHFEVQRSKDGLTFETLASVKGKGNSTAVIRYAYTDANPGSGLNYYRLKQVDQNGKYEISRAISLEVDVLKVGPNPTSSIIKVDSKGLVEVQLYTLAGTLLKKSTTNEIQMSDLAAGSYLLKIVTNYSTTYKKVVKQ